MTDLARANVREAGLEDRVEVRAADIMADEWPASDAVLLSHVLDGYGPERAAHLVRRIHTHLPADGLLLVHSHMPTLASGLFPAMFGLILLVNTEEGEVRDVDEIRGWVEDAGFRRITTRNVSLLSGLLTATK